MRIVDERALRAVVSPGLAVAAMREAFAADGAGHTRVPAVINLDTPAGEFHVKTAYVEGVPVVAVKVASGFFGNVRKGLATGSGLMMVFDASTGFPLVLLHDNGFLTDARTGAAGALAADLLARPTLDVVGVLGSGVQARWQVRCLACVRSIRRIVVWSPTAAHVEAYRREMEAEGFDVRLAASPEEVCHAADLLIAATPSRLPLVRAEWLRDGMHVTAVGADAPGKQELDAACLARADLVVVDRLSQCAAFGDLKHALDLGLIHESAVHAELGEIAAGLKPGRTSPNQLTIADLTGVGFQDTAIAHAALESLPDSEP